MTDIVKHENLVQALCAAQSEIDHAINDSKSVYSGYASLSSVISTVKEPLNKNGVYFQQISNDCDSGVIIETIFMGYGEQISAGRVYIPADNRKAFAFGSAMTYARRYSLVQACGIASIDDDGVKAQENPPEKLEVFELRHINGRILRVNNAKAFLDEHQATVNKLNPEDATNFNDLNRDALIEIIESTKADESISDKQRKNRLDYCAKHAGLINE